MQKMSVCSPPTHPRPPFARHQMRKATRHKCTSLFCLGVVVVPLIVFVLSAFLAIWLWLVEADLAGCFKPGGEDILPPSPPPPGPLDEEELGSGSRQLAIGSGAPASHTNATSGAASERPICSYYEWCALGRKSPPATQPPPAAYEPALCAQGVVCAWKPRRRRPHQHPTRVREPARRAV